MARDYNGVPGAWAKWNEDRKGLWHKTSARVYFKEREFVSYYTTVAMYDKTGAYAIITSEKYSVSTTSHCNAAASAASVSFYAPMICDDEQDDKVANCLHMWKGIKILQEAAIKQWKGDFYFHRGAFDLVEPGEEPVRTDANANSYRSYITNSYRTLERYIVLSGVKGFKPLEPLADIMDDIDKGVTARLEDYMSRKKVAARRRYFERAVRERAAEVILSSG